MSNPRLHRIVLTGGPCGGKTTAMARLPERLRALGFNVFVVPEAATLLINGGCSFVGANAEQIYSNQWGIAKTQIAMEGAFARRAAFTPGESVMLCDRGLMDAKAYMAPDQFDRLAHDIHDSLQSDRSHRSVIPAMRDHRYDSVIHLVSAADGAEEFYSKESNGARYETVEQARDLDKRLREAWLGHPHLRIIDNSTDFATKMHRVDEVVFRALGVPQPMECERRFLVKKFAKTWPVPSRDVEIFQFYLQSSADVTERLRGRGEGESWVYTHTVKEKVARGQHIERERQISQREYEALSLRRDPTLRTIRKTRRCFLWEGLYWELDFFREPESLNSTMILEVEVDDIDQKLELPPFIIIEREITGEDEWSNRQLAARKT